MSVLFQHLQTFSSEGVVRLVEFVSRYLTQYEKIIFSKTFLIKANSALSGVWVCFSFGDPHEISHQREAFQVSGLR